MKKRLDCDKVNTDLLESENKKLTTANDEKETELQNLYELLDNKDERISILTEEICKLRDACEFKDKVIEDWKFRSNTVEKAIDLLYKFMY